MTGSSSGRSPQDAPPLSLPPAVLHASTELHPDSAEAVDRERYGIAQELSSINETTDAELYPPSPAHEPSLRTSVSHGASEATATTATDPLGPNGRNSRRYRLRRQIPHWYDPIVKFWTTQISVSVDERVGGSHRDHLALERTFLGYLRTSLMFAMVGVIIAQLFRLQHHVNPHPNFGFYVLGTPLAASFIAFGMLVLLIGAVRFWRHQNALVRGKAIAGGWELLVIMGGSVVLCFAAFVLITAIDIHKEVNS